MEEDYKLFISKVSEEKLTARFGLKLFDFGVSQDWDTECADGARTEEFLDYYEGCSSLTDDDRFALMTLIIASFEDAMHFEPPGDTLREKLRHRLMTEFDAHVSTIRYWCCWDVTDPNPDYVFEITPFMRDIWCSLRPRPEPCPG